MMKLDELKKALIDLGVDTRLVEMPAIMERVAKLLLDCRDIEEIREQISILENGRIVVDENPTKEDKDKIIMQFQLTENGARIEIHMEYDAKDEFPIIIDVDKNGMDSKLMSYSMDGDSHMRIERMNGNIQSEFYNICVGGNSRVFEDNGEACLAYSFEKRPMKRNYEKNKAYFMRNYPETAKFYERLETSKSISDDNDQR